MKNNKLVLVNWISSEIAEVWLNRAEKRNAYSKEFLTELINTLVSLNKHKFIKVCLIRAKGDDFCAGGDIKSMLAQSDLFEGPRTKLEATYKKFIQKLSLTLDQVRYLTVAVVQGGAIGAGVGLALACDQTWCKEDAYFKLPFFSLALVPADGSFWRLQRRIGYSQSLNLLLKGTKLEAHEALKQGVVNHIVNSDLDITKNLMEFNIDSFEKNDWSKIVLSLRKTNLVSLDIHLKQMRQIQAKLQLKKNHTEAIKKILK